MGVRMNTHAITAIEAAAAADDEAGLSTRTPEQVLESHRHAIAARDWPTVRCNYAADAIVISDLGVTVGADAIVAELETITASIHPAMPVVREQQVVAVGSGTHMVRVLFTLTAPFVDVPDGIDTYIVRQGRIVGQTAHGVPRRKDTSRG